MRKGFLRAGLLLLSVFFLLVPAHRSSGVLSRQVLLPDGPTFDERSIEDGDIILRNGTGIISEMFASFSLNDKSFSHAGILLRTDSGVTVCHTLGGEAWGPGGIRFDRLSEFCHSSVTDSIGVFRMTEDKKTRQSIRTYCMIKSAAGLTFDRQFSLADTSEMYCTEFVYRAFLAASSGAISLPLTSFNGKRYVSCDNLFLNRYARSVPIN